CRARRGTAAPGPARRGCRGAGTRRRPGTDPARAGAADATGGSRLAARRRRLRRGEPPGCGVSVGPRRGCGWPWHVGVTETPAVVTGAVMEAPDGTAAAIAAHQMMTSCAAHRGW